MKFKSNSKTSPPRLPATPPQQQATTAKTKAYEYWGFEVETEVSGKGCAIPRSDGGGKCLNICGKDLLYKAPCDIKQIKVINVINDGRAHNANLRNNDIIDSINHMYFGAEQWEPNPLIVKFHKFVSEAYNNGNYRNFKVKRGEHILDIELPMRIVHNQETSTNNPPFHSISLINGQHKLGTQTSL